MCKISWVGNCLNGNSINCLREFKTMGAFLPRAGRATQCYLCFKSNSSSGKDKWAEDMRSQIHVYLYFSALYVFIACCNFLLSLTNVSSIIYYVVNSPPLLQSLTSTYPKGWLQTKQDFLQVTHHNNIFLPFWPLIFTFKWRKEKFLFVYLFVWLI